MSRIYLLLILIACANLSYAQEVFQKNEKYGLSYDGSEYYAAVFDQIVIREFFVYGKMGDLYFNLSRNKENVHHNYKKFNFSLYDRLLVIGEREDGKLDLLDETGQHFYLKEGDYSKVFVKPKNITYGNDDVLMVKRDGKLGLYNWPERREILNPEYRKISLHESCNSGSYFIYAKSESNNLILDESGNEILKFKSRWVDDMYPTPNCEGYFLNWKGLIGFCCKMRDGRYFLIKPRYEEIIFPNNDTSVILVRNDENFGLYYNFQRMLKCKYEEIELLDHPYMIARVVRKGDTKMLKRTGELVVNF